MSPELKAAVLRMYDKQKEAKQKQAEQGKHDQGNWGGGRKLDPLTHGAQAV